MLEAIGCRTIGDLYAHLPERASFGQEAGLGLPEELTYEETAKTLAEMAGRNPDVLSFIGDGLPNWKQPEIVKEVANLRRLSTSYTPYQPERSQGTLITQWIYQCLMAKLTGFEAVNASLYDRSTAMVEAALCAVRLAKNKTKILVSGACFEADRAVLRTLLGDTEIELEEIPVDAETGLTDLGALRDALGERSVAGVIYPQVNHLGLLEDVELMTDCIHDLDTLAIAVVDPFLLGKGGLKPPTTFGRKGADMVVGEAQHLALEPLFGGPGLGLFAVRMNAEVKNMVRATPGRYVGEARDTDGKDCLVMVLSTREQHIRKDKATSNICSNQAFVATLAGAAMLARGERGLEEALRTAREQTLRALKLLEGFEGIGLVYPNQGFFNEIVLKLPGKAADFLRQAREHGIQAGIEVNDRLPGGGKEAIKLSFSDLHGNEETDRLVAVVRKLYQPKCEGGEKAGKVVEIFQRSGPTGLPDLGEGAILKYYRRLADLNIAPEETCYPLGSCTMKYNPYLNDWAAGLPGFARAHPQSPIDDVQGCLEVLFEIQEWFKGITGLAGVTTQPVAGAQGELVGLKLFQAYHRQHGQGHRNLVLIPSSAHGTNFATATMAGYTQARGGGIILLEADEMGRINRSDFEAKLALHGERLAGIMVTNPNTGGVFEEEFAVIADAVHQAGGLVYMDGANMNAIAGWTNLGSLGVDAVHNNLHKTWTIPHGGGGPGDAIVAVSERLVEFLPGHQIVKRGDRYDTVRPEHSIGSFHRHWGNFAHKVRAYTYLLRLGREGVPRMAGVAVLAARYLHERLKPFFKTLPEGSEAVPRMHEFIISLGDEDFDALEKAGIARGQVIPSMGKLFLDFGYHAPTVAFPEVFGLMIEPTESYRKSELDRFADAVIAIGELVREHPEVLKGAPYFTPVRRIDEVGANRNPVLAGELFNLPELFEPEIASERLLQMPIGEIKELILKRASG